jgi:hypothetical protein
MDHCYHLTVSHQMWGRNLEGRAGTSGLLGYASRYENPKTGEGTSNGDTIPSGCQ